MLRYYLFLIGMTVLGSFGAYFLKKATAGNKGLLQAFFTKELYIGGVLYFASALVNIYVLKYLDYTVVLPLTSLAYIWTMFIAGFIMKEKITRNKIIGVICIMVGAVLISLG